MVFDHRKLLSDFANTNSSDFCELVCNTTNIDVFCPPPCIKLCPQPDLPTTTTDHHSHKSHNLHLLLIISLSIFSATCLIFGLYAFFKYYKRWDISRRRSAQPHQEVTHDVFLDEDHGPMVDHPIWYIRTIGLQPSIINSITVCKYKRGDGLVEGTECSVCLSEFEEDETLRLLPKCNHAFHIPCIDTWLRSHTNCPLCRAGIVANTTSLPVPVPVPVPEQSVDNLVVGEEAEVVISESSDEFRRERGDGDCELRMETEEEGETRVENGAGSGETSMEEVQPRRRSVSMDSVSASMIRVAIANAQSGESTQLAKANQKNMAVVPKKENVNQSLSRLVGGSSIGRSLQNGPVSMKRSFSCSGKVFLSRYTRSQSRNQSTVLPS